MPKRKKPVPGGVGKPGGITKPGHLTRSLTKPGRDAIIKAALEKLKKEQIELDKQRAKALANMPKAPLGNRGDGKFHIAFVKMGQGDCTVMSTPAGRTILIDCGSDATESSEDQKELYKKHIRDTVYGPKFLKGTKTLDMLILTHPDTDHYNQLKKVLDADIKIQKVYHSSKMENYSTGKVSEWVKGQVTSPRNILKVTLNETGAAQLGTETVTADSLNTGRVPCLDDRGAIRILKEDKCTVSFLAGNVHRDSVGDNSNDTNRGSLVTLIETFGKKILICGDATRSTEAFILNKYKKSLNGLKGVDLMHIPHHGSNVTSSSDALVRALQPKKCIISAGKEVICDHLPSLTTIQRYWGFQKDTVSDHEIFYWEPGGMGSYFHTSSFTKKNLYVTGSNSTIEVTFP